MKDRPYYVAEVRVVGDEVMFLDPEGLDAPGAVVSEARHAARRKYGERVFHVAYLKLGRWIAGSGGNFASAVFYLRERMEEATED